MSATFCTSCGASAARRSALAVAPLTVAAVGRRSCMGARAPGEAVRVVELPGELARQRLVAREPGPPRRPRSPCRGRARHGVPIAALKCARSRLGEEMFARGSSGAEPRPSGRASWCADSAATSAAPSRRPARRRDEAARVSTNRRRASVACRSCSRSRRSSLRGGHERAGGAVVAVEIGQLDLLRVVPGGHIGELRGTETLLANAVLVEGVVAQGVRPGGGPREVWATTCLAHVRMSVVSLSFVRRMSAEILARSRRATAPRSSPRPALAGDHVNAAVLTSTPDLPTPGRPAARRARSLIDVPERLEEQVMAPKVVRSMHVMRGLGIRSFSPIPTLPELVGFSCTDPPAVLGSKTLSSMSSTARHVRVQRGARVAAPSIARLICMMSVERPEDRQPERGGGLRHVGERDGGRSASGSATVGSFRRAEIGRLARWACIASSFLCRAARAAPRPPRGCDPEQREGPEGSHRTTSGGGRRASGGTT